MQYGIPSWIVTLRHCGTHEKLPSLGALRAGAEFCLNWLRAYYWRPQRLTIGEHVGEARSRTATPSVAEVEGMVEREGGVGELERREEEPNEKKGHIWRLTRGLCKGRDELVSLLVHSHYTYVSCCSSAAEVMSLLQ